jgi:hypothetical protein
VENGRRVPQLCHFRAGAFMAMEALAGRPVNRYCSRQFDATRIESLDSKHDRDSDLSIDHRRVHRRNLDGEEDRSTILLDPPLPVLRK